MRFRIKRWGPKLGYTYKVSLSQIEAIANVRVLSLRAKPKEAHVVFLDGPRQGQKWWIFPDEFVDCKKLFPKWYPKNS